MKTTLSDFKKKFKTDELKIYETEFWTWCLRPEQVTLGSTILFLKRECTELSSVRGVEFEDLNHIINIIETTLTKSFSYNKINYLMLMMVDDQVHTHVLPRYGKRVQFQDVSWVDSCWPAPSDLKAVELSDRELMGILDFLKRNLPL